MCAERSSWLGKGAQVNGLFAAHMPRRRRTKVLPTSHADEGAARGAATAAEFEAYKSVIDEESRVKDKLMETLSQRCSEAEARVEQVLLEKARIERELASAKYSLQAVEKRNADVEAAEKATAAARAHETAAQNRVALLEQQLAHASEQLLEIRQTHARELRGREDQVRELTASIEQHQHELRRLGEALAAEQQAANERESNAAGSEQKRLATAARCEELEAANNTMAAKLEKLAAENVALKHANTQIVDRLEAGEASLENSRKRVEAQADKFKEQERMRKAAEEQHRESEARATRLAEQLKASNKKAVFLNKKTEALQTRCNEKETEAAELKGKLEEMSKKYRAAKERLDYVKLTMAAGNGAPGCTTPAGSRSNNNNEEEDPDACGSLNQLLPGMSRRGNPFAGAGSKSACRAGDARTEEHRSAPMHAAAASAASAATGQVSRNMPDPATAPDSDAPEWMKF